MTYYTGDYPLERHTFPIRKPRQPKVPVLWIWVRTGGNWFSTADNSTDRATLDARVPFWAEHYGAGNVAISGTRPAA